MHPLAISVVVLDFNLNQGRRSECRIYCSATPLQINGTNIISGDARSAEGTADYSGHGEPRGEQTVVNCHAADGPRLKWSGRTN